METLDDVENLNIQSEKIIITNQTTMSQWDVSDIMNRAMEKYPKASIHNEICMATQVRQEAVAEQASQTELVLVVGDPKSNNSNRLAQVSEQIANTPAYRISDISELQLSWLHGIKKIGVTSGASTPTPITKEVITFLQQYDENDPTMENREKSRRIKNSS